MNKTAEVIMAGTGGRGVLLSGLLLARAAMQRYKYVTWSPTYGAAMRGGSCECTVILSDDDITSPVLSHADTVLAIAANQAKPFEDRIKAGGLLITESAGLQGLAELYGLKLEREDIRRMEVPAIEMASHLGNIQSANLILLGAYLGATRVFPLEMLEEEVDRRLGRKKELRIGVTAMQVNKEALREGFILGEEFTSGARA
ncbi:MAG: 2-oxoacid:acceptor oxidoreductase family protein [Chloroflexota bacterium]|nr:2-oxoacid:acceptor oxidoreductase family protein [Chloroflexota bacterium]